MRKKTTQEIQQFANSRNIEFLSAYKSSNVKHFWKCGKCDHIWDAIPNSIRQGTGCPKCAGKAYKLDDIKQLAKDNSFTLVSKKFINMTTKHKWRCQDGHEWMATPSKIKSGTGCPVCHTYRGEEKCRFIFEQLTGEKFPKLTRSFGSKMEIDGYCECLLMAFEYHGKHHYQRIKYWHKSEQDFIKQQKRDQQKVDLCKKYGITLLIIPYFEDTEKYVKSLLEKCEININRDVDWSQFQGSAFRLRQVQIAAHNINLECLNNNYVSAHFPMNFKCKKCGRRFQSTSNYVKSGYGCLQCGGTMKKTVQDMQLLSKEQKLEFLSNQYINAKVKHEWKCLKCNYIFWKTPDDIRQGKTCPKCGIKRRWQTRRLNTNDTIDTGKDEITSRHTLLIASKD